MRTYVLTRFPDTTDGKISFTWEDKDPQEFMLIQKLISWDWDWIRKEAAKLEVGESKEFLENV